MRSLAGAAVVGPGERDPGGVHPLRPIDQVRFAAEVGPSAIITEAHADRRGPLVAHVQRAPAETLRPEVPGLVPPPRDLPVLDHGRPTLAAVGGRLDPVLHLRARRTA